MNFLVGARGTISGGADGELDAYIHAFIVRSREWSHNEVRAWSRNPFGPFHMIDETPWLAIAAAEPSGRIMSSLAGYGGLAGHGGIAGPRGGLAG